MKKILCVLVLALALGGIFALPFPWLTPGDTDVPEGSAQASAGQGEPASAPEPVAMKVKAPEITGIEEWINSKPLKLKDLRGQVVALHFGRSAELIASAITRGTRAGTKTTRKKA